MSSVRDLLRIAFRACAQGETDSNAVCSSDAMRTYQPRSRVSCANQAGEALGRCSGGCGGGPYRLSRVVDEAVHACEPPACEHRRYGALGRPVGLGGAHYRAIAERTVGSFVFGTAGAHVAEYRRVPPSTAGTVS